MLGIDRLAYWAQPVRLRRADRDRSARRGRRDRPDEPVEAGHARRADLPRRGLPGRHRPGLRHGHADPAHQRLRRARQRRHALPAAGRPRHHRARRHRSSGRSPRRCIHKIGRPASVLKIDARRARNVVVSPPHLQPRRPADRRRRQVRHGRVRRPRRQGPAAVPLVVRRLHPEGSGRRVDPAASRHERTDSQLVVLAFAYDSRTRSATPRPRSSKYFLQLHFGIKKDYRLPRPARNAATSTGMSD